MVTVEVRTLPVKGRTTLLKRFRSRAALPKGGNVFRLTTPTRAATRLVIVTAGGEKTTFRIRIRR